MENDDAVSWKQICDLYRTVCLNVRYYGERANCLTVSNKWGQIAAAITSSATLLAVVKQFGKFGGIILVGFAIIAAVTAVAMPFLGLSERAKEFEKLHFIYSELCAQIDVLMQKIRREGKVRDEDIAALYVLQQLYGHLGSLDETKPDRKLIGMLETEINVAIPPEALTL